MSSVTGAPSAENADGSTPRGRVRFGVFEMDPRSGELRKSGALVRLQQQPFRVLALLVSRPGDLVTRDEIRREVWGDDVFVDYEQGLNFSIKQIRSAIGDQADSPRFIETLPRRGYRFIAPVEFIGGDAFPGSLQSSEAAAPSASRRSRPRRLWTAAGLIALLLAGGLALLVSRPEPSPVPQAPPRRVIVAVLPFENLDNDANRDYFSDGLTEELIAEIGRQHPDRIGVIARTSAMAYRKSGKTIAQIARELGADFVVEGGVRRSGESVRVTAHLTRANDPSELWSESYERRMADVLILQRELAARIARSTEAQIAAPSAPMGRAGADPRAYDEYLKGRYQANKKTADGWRGSLPHLEAAAHSDPTFPLVHLALAEAYVGLVDTGAMTPNEGFPKAKASAERALALDSGLAQAHVLLGTTKLYHDWDLPGAEKAFERALEMAPGSAAAHYAKAGLLAARGRHDEARTFIRRALSLDPLSPEINADLGWFAFCARRYEEAVTQFRRAMELEPRTAWVRMFVAYSLHFLGRHEEARAEALAYFDAVGAPAQAVLAVTQASARDAINMWGQQRLSTAREFGESDHAQFMFETNAFLGNTDEAFRWLDRCIEVRPRWLIASLGADPRLDSIRADPRFKAALVRVGLGDDQSRR